MPPKKPTIQERQQVLVKLAAEHAAAEEAEKRARAEKVAVWARYSAALTALITAEIKEAQNGPAQGWQLKHRQLTRVVKGGKHTWRLTVGFSRPYDAFGFERIWRVSPVATSALRSPLGDQGVGSSLEECIRRAHAAIAMIDPPAAATDSDPEGGAA